MRRSVRFPLMARLGHENWLALGLLLLTFTILILGIPDNVTGLEFNLLWPIALFGLVLGWMLAASSRSGLAASILCILLGPSLIMIQIGKLISTLTALAASLFAYVWQAAQSGATPSASAVIPIWDELASDVAAIISRLYEWLLALTRGEPRFDPVAIAFLWLLVLWGAAVWASWSVRRRHQPLLALLPTLILLSVMLTLSDGSAWYLAPALSLTLILKATASHTLTEQKWLQDGASFSSRPHRNVIWTASGLALALMFVALITPSPSIYRLLDYARDLTQQGRNQELARSLGLELQPIAREVDVFARERFGGLPTRHLIGSGPELSEQPVMVITVEDSESLMNQLHYWRGVAYDRYTGRGWETGDTATITYEAGESAGRLLENQRLVRQEVHPLTDLAGLLYATGTLSTVDETFQVAWLVRYRGTTVYTDFFAAATPGRQTGPYRADSRVPLFSESKLRAASQNIPDWIAARFLVLPSGVSDRVRALARDLTATEPTPYDRAVAIEQYLRQFPYTLDLPAPPADQEIADYFLFELQRGYCDYYATTMVVLARAAGLPARLVTGFVTGKDNQEEGQFLITADLAHSWPEIYFPEYGWIPFEPTGGHPTIDRAIAAQSQETIEPQAELEPITAARSRARWIRLFLITTAVLLLTLTATFVWWLLDFWRLRYLAPNKAIIRLFEQLQRTGRHLDVRSQLSETPHEYAGRLSEQLITLSKTGAQAASLASAPAHIDWLTTLYTRSLFSPFQPGVRHRTKAIRIYSRLRIQLLWAALLLRVKKPSVT